MKTIIDKIEQAEIMFNKLEKQEWANLMREVLQEVKALWSKTNVCGPWISADTPPPPGGPERDYGDYHHSDDVLVMNEDGDMYTAYYEHYTDPDDTPEDKGRWFQFGRDGYVVEGITLWKKLPERPKQ